MATPAKRPVPEGMHTVTPYLWFNGDGLKAVEFYQAGLGAEIVGQIAVAPDGMVRHALLKLGDSHVMLSDIPAGGYEQGPRGNTTMSLWLFVENCDDLCDRAIRAGAKVRTPLEDQFWGDRMGSLEDPFGHVWMIASRKFDPTPDELKSAQGELGKKTRK